MKATQLFVRCFAEQRGGQWQAFCLDFNLAAQAGSFDEAKKKLEAQIDEYVYDALAGDDRAHAAVLLRRKAPLALRMRYQAYRWGWRLRGLFSGGDGNGSAGGGHRSFKELLPLVPAGSR